MTLRPRDRVALAAVAVLVLAGAYYMLALRPEQRKAKSLDAQIAIQREALSTAQQQVAQGRASQASLRAKAADSLAVGRAVPQQADIPGLLRTLQHAADQEHVKVGAVILAGSSTAVGTTSTASTPASATHGVTPVGVQLTFTGSYFALQNMLQRIDRFVVVSGGKVRATGPLVNVGSLQLSGAGKLTTQLSATLYQLGSSPNATGTGSGSAASPGTAAPGGATASSATASTGATASRGAAQ